MDQLINLELLKNFDNKYEPMDFFNLVKNCTNITHLTEKERLENVGWFATFLQRDYAAKRWNPFALNYNINSDLRFINEVRKSLALVHVESGFYDAFQDCRTVEEVKELRSELLLSDLFQDYEDRRWQYYWVQAFLIPKAQRLDYEWDIDILFEDMPETYRRIPDFAEEFENYWEFNGEIQDMSWKLDDAYK